MEVNGSIYVTVWLLTFFKIYFSAEERNSNRSETTWGWVYDDRIFILKWTIPLRLKAGHLRPVCCYGCHVQLHPHNIYKIYCTSRFCARTHTHTDVVSVRHCACM